MKPGGGRAKGAAFEREIVQRLREVFPNARRRAMQARGGHEGADIDNTGRWWIECGHGKRMDAAKKWAQAAVDCVIERMAGVLADPPVNAIPVAVTRRDRGPVLVTMELQDWLALVKAVNVRIEPRGET